MVEFESESEMSRYEAATFLRRFADELEGVGGEGLEDSPDIGEVDERTAETMTVIVGDESATVVLPEVLELDVEIESRSPLFGSDVEQSIELEFSWEVEDLPEDETIEVV